jgi:hypothetical protein
LESKVKPVLFFLFPKKFHKLLPLCSGVINFRSVFQAAGDRINHTLKDMDA